MSMEFWLIHMLHFVFTVAVKRMFLLDLMSSFLHSQTSEAAYRRGARLKQKENKIQTKKLLTKFGWYKLSQRKPKIFLCTCMRLVQI